MVLANIPYLFACMMYNAPKVIWQTLLCTVYIVITKPNWSIGGSKNLKHKSKLEQSIDQAF